MDPGVPVLLHLGQPAGRAEGQGSDGRRQEATCRVGDGHPLHCWAAGPAYVCRVNLGAHYHKCQKHPDWVNSPNYKYNDVLLFYWRAAELHFSWPSRENWVEWVTGWLQQEQTEAQQLPDPIHGPGLAECGLHTPVNARISMWPHLCAWLNTHLLLLLWGKTCGRSSVWSQWSGRGVLAVSSNVCILWHNSDLVLLLSPAEQTHRMSIGNPAALRVTDVKGGDCTTFNPCWETDLQL